MRRSSLQLVNSSTDDRFSLLIMLYFFWIRFRLLFCLNWMGGGGDRDKSWPISVKMILFNLWSDGKRFRSDWPGLCVLSANRVVSGVFYFIKFSILLQIFHFYVLLLVFCFCFLFDWGLRLFMSALTPIFVNEISFVYPPPRSDTGSRDHNVCPIFSSRNHI